MDPKAYDQFTEYGGPLPVARPVDPRGQPRGDAHFPVPHKAEFSGLSTTPARSYLSTFDEAMWSNRENAYRCRLDPVVDACMRLRTYPTALLSHHIVPDDDENEYEVACAARAERLLKWLPQITFMKRWLLNDGDWTGRSALKTRWQWQYKQNRLWMVPTAFEPVSGDKLVFKLDGRVGVRVGGMFTDFSGQVESADWSRAYFLNAEEREQLVVYHFEPTDADFFRPQMAGAIKGQGLRNVIYWLWALKIRVWGMGMDFLQWFAKGLTFYYFKSGNKAHYDELREWILNQDGSTAMLLPYLADDNMPTPPVQVVQPSMANAQFIQTLVTQYFDDLIRQIIVGQTLTSGTAPTGLGSGVAAAHQTTFDQIVKYDAIALGETFSSDLLGPFYRANFPGVTPGHWVFDIDDPNAQQMIDNAQAIFAMGGALPEEPLLEVAGLPTAEPGDTILSNVQPMQPAAVDGLPEGVPVVDGQPQGGPQPPVKMSRAELNRLVKLARAVRRGSRIVVRG